MKLNELLDLDKTETFQTEWNNKSFEFTARTNILTPEWLQLHTDVSGKPINLATMCAEVLTQWTIEDYPPTLENLKKLPTSFLWHLVAKMSETWNGDAEDKKKSPKTSEA